MINLKKNTILVAAALSLTAVAAPASAGSANGEFRVAQACGYYIILGCSKSQRGANRTLSNLGGPGVGGPAGAFVVDTNAYPNFRNGWFCVADGPYNSASAARSIAWTEAVPDAYVKSAC